MSICVEYVKKLISWPVVIVFETIILAPNHDKSNIHVYIVICITGAFSTINFSAKIKLFLTSPEAFLNLFISNSSLTADFTVLIPVKFSCTLAFNASYFLKTAVNLGNATFIISANINPKNITDPKNTSDKLGLIKTDITIADISKYSAPLSLSACAIPIFSVLSTAHLLYLS